MLEASVLQKIARRARKAGVVVLLVSILMSAGAAVFGAAIAVDSLQVGLVAGTSQVDRTRLGLDKGIIGDTIRVSALVTNTATTAVGEFEVRFFFTETISGEHGLLGTQVVSRLEPGESKRPVILFDTAAMSPGIYAFSAEADPQNTLQDGNQCDNVTPRGACAGTGAEAADKYSLVLLREGKQILRGPGSQFPVCRMGPFQVGGKLEESVTLTLYNMGTETMSVSDLLVYGYYRQGLTAPADEFKPLVEDASGNPVPLTTKGSLGSPGSEGQIIITLKYDALGTKFAPQGQTQPTRKEPGEDGNVLGYANPVQIRITIHPVGGGAPQNVFLPDQFELSQFYSTVDLWTFPARTSCCTEGCSSFTSVPVAPVVAGGYVFHATRGKDGDALHVLKVRTGEEIGTWSAPAGKTIAATAAAYKESAKLWSVFVATSDGKVHALQGVEKAKDQGEFLATQWSSVRDDLVEGVTRLVLSIDATETVAKVIVGSENGAFVLDAATGATSREATQYGAVTSAPVYIDTTGALWFATDQVLHGILANRTESTFDAQDRITTDLVLGGDSQVLFFGGESGDVYAMGATVTSGTRTSLDRVTAVRAVSGLTIASKAGDKDGVLFVGGDIGEVVRVEYAGSGSQRFATPDELDSTALFRSLRPLKILGAPAFLPNRDGTDAVVIFAAAEVRYSGTTRRPILLAFKDDLQNHAEVDVWGVDVPFAFEPEEGGTPTGALLSPVVDADELEPSFVWKTPTVLVAASDGRLYAFDLTQFVK